MSVARLLLSGRSDPEVTRQTYTIVEAARILGISAWCAYELAKTGRLPVIRLGHRRVVPRRALDKMLDATT